MATQIHQSKYVTGVHDVSPKAEFLFGGYSWVRKEFQLWSISYHKKINQFVSNPAQWYGYSKDGGRIILRKKKISDGDSVLGRIAFAGDQAPLARRMLSDRIRFKNEGGKTIKPLDMEPFEVVRDMLRDSRHSETIGGAPQIVKVYQYMRSAALGIYWPDRESGKIHLQGRACLGYERVDRWVLDPDSLLTEAQPVPTEGIPIFESATDDA